MRRLTQVDDKPARVDAMYAAFFQGDLDAALAQCAPGAQYHAVSSVTGDWAHLAGSRPIADYLGLLPSVIAALADYRVEQVGRDTIDDLVVTRLRSTHGSGVMVFRVTDDGITDIWTISNEGREASAPF